MFHHLHTGGPKQMCVLAHLGYTPKASTSYLRLKRWQQYNNNKYTGSRDDDSLSKKIYWHVCIIPQSHERVGDETFNGTISSTVSHFKIILYFAFWSSLFVTLSQNSSRFIKLVQIELTISELDHINVIKLVRWG